MFNIFINDIFHFTHHTKLYNYADDNTISYASPHFDTMKQTLEAEGSALVDWFAANQMEANPEKFQGIAVGKKAHALKPTFFADIECTDDVKVSAASAHVRPLMLCIVGYRIPRLRRTPACRWRVVAQRAPTSDLYCCVSLDIVHRACDAHPPVGGVWSRSERPSTSDLYTGS